MNKTYDISKVLYTIHNNTSRKLEALNATLIAVGLFLLIFMESLNILFHFMAVKDQTLILTIVFYLLIIGFTIYLTFSLFLTYIELRLNLIKERLSNVENISDLTPDDIAEITYVSYTNKELWMKTFYHFKIRLFLAVIVTTHMCYNIYYMLALYSPTLVL